MSTSQVILDQRTKKARQGVFFISLALISTGLVLSMLVTLVGYMLYRGSSRLFYSPVYELRLLDGTIKTTDLNQNVEFDVINEDGKIAAKSALQAGKYFMNLQTETLKYASAPVPQGTVVEVWKDEEVEVPDPYAEDGEEATLVKIKKAVRKESFSDAKEFRYDTDKQIYTLVLADGKERVFDAASELQFRQGNDLLNHKTLVTRYLQNNPEEANRRVDQIRQTLEKLAQTGYPVDVRWKAYVVAHVSHTTPDGSRYTQEERIEDLPAVSSFASVDRWNWFQFFWDWPRAGNTEGGVFPCIFGTVLMTLLMTLFVAPLGIAAAVYLKEYARDTLMTRMIRLSVANLAGVPSIVFGLFGLGFFVLTIGRNIDHTFSPGQTWLGTPCVLWASLTMALLTLPVMIVATEEALRTVPRELREGALALGATKFSTIYTIVIPTALPGILTGLILAVARGAGEVAPLLLTGVVAQKDQLPTAAGDTFMNLAYHIYDLSMKAQPNKIEEAQALAFSSALVLILVVLVMNVFAILLRARLSRIRIS
jgi:phosphate transport system permease protein